MWEVKGTDFSVDFAQDTDINDNPENPVIGVHYITDTAAAAGITATTTLTAASSAETRAAGAGIE